MAAEHSPHGVHRGTRAIQRMVEYAPSTGGLALWVKHEDVREAPDTTADAPAGALAGAPAAAAPADHPLAATDGHTIFYSAAFAKLPLSE